MEDKTAGQVSDDGSDPLVVGKEGTDGDGKINQQVAEDDADKEPKDREKRHYRQGRAGYGCQIAKRAKDTPVWENCPYRLAKPKTSTCYKTAGTILQAVPAALY